MRDVNHLIVDAYMAWIRESMTIIVCLVFRTDFDEQFSETQHLFYRNRRDFAEKIKSWTVD